MAIKTVQCRLYPTKIQQELIDKTFEYCREVYNLGLDMYKTKTNYYATAAKLSELKLDPEYSYLKEVDAVALQRSLLSLSNAFKLYFKKIAGRPARKLSNTSYQTTSPSIRIENGRIKLPKLGLVKIKGEREMREINMATVIKKPTGKYFVNIYGDVVENETHKHSIPEDNSEALAKCEEKIKREQRRLHRKQKGSKNYEKQRVKLAKAYEKAANIRKDFESKQS